MRVVVILALSLAALFFTAHDATAQIAASNGVEVEVRKLERAWLDAYEKHDTKAMQTIVADDFLITFADGSQQTKPQILEMIKRPANPANANRFSTVDVISRVYGDTVVLTGRVVTEYKRNGELKKEESLYTDTYVRRNGVWQVVASHLSNVPQPKKTN